MKAVDGLLAPKVRAHLQKKVERLEAESIVTVKFQDTPVNRRGFVMVGHAKRPFTLADFTSQAALAVVKR